MSNKASGGLKTVIVFLIISLFPAALLNLFSVINFFRGETAFTKISAAIPCLIGWVFAVVVISIAKSVNKKKTNGSALNLVILSILMTCLPFAIIFVLNKNDSLVLERNYSIILSSTLLVLFILLTVGNIIKNRILLRISYLLSSLAFIIFFVYNLFFILHFAQLRTFSIFNLVTIEMYIYFILYQICFFILYICSFVLFYSTDKKLWNRVEYATVLAGATAKVAYEKGMIQKDDYDEAMSGLSERDKIAMDLALKDPEAKKEIENMLEIPEIKNDIDSYNNEKAKATNSSSSKPSSAEDEIMAILDKNNYDK